MAIADDPQALAEGLEVAGDWLAVGLDPRPERLAAFPWQRAGAATLAGVVAELADRGVARFVLAHGGHAPDLAVIGPLAVRGDIDVLVAGGVDRPRRDPPPARRGDRGHHPRRGAPVGGHRFHRRPGGSRLSSDPNRPRPRSSKKRRAVQSGGSLSGARPPRPSVAQAGATRGGALPAAFRRPGGRSVPSSSSRSAWPSPAVRSASAAARARAPTRSAAGGNPAGLGDPERGGRPRHRRAARSPAPGSRELPEGAARRPPPAGSTKVVTIDTPKGAIEITLKADLSPIAVGNFVALASCGYYDNVVFHRRRAGLRHPGRRRPVRPDDRLRPEQGRDGRSRLRDPGRAGHDAVRQGHRGDGPDRGPELGRVAVLHRARPTPPSRRSRTPTPTRSSAR